MKNTLLLLCFILITDSLQAQNEIIPKNLELIETDELSFLYKEFTGESEFLISTEGIIKINMETGASKVEVLPADDDLFSIHAEVVVIAKKLKSAYGIIDDYLNLAVSRDNNELLLESLFEYDENDENLKESFGFVKTSARRINLTVRVPGNIDVRINDRSGELVILGLNNNLDVNDGSGSIRIENITGNLKLVDGSGEITVRGINIGETDGYWIDIKDHSSSLSVNNITGKTKIDDSSGAIYMDKVKGDLDIHDTSGAINVSKVTGLLTINDTSGGIVATNIKGSVILSDSSGGIYINDATEDVIVKKDGSGSMSVHNVSGEVRR